MSFSMNKNLLTTLILCGLMLALVLSTQIVDTRIYTRIATILCINIVLVIGLQAFMGNSGILSFAHIGFMGVGAYVSALFTIPRQLKGMALPDLYPFMDALSASPIVAIFIGGIVAALVAAAVSYPLMRLSDAAAVITSFALLVVLHTVMLHWSEVTNGPRTLFGLPSVTSLELAAVIAAASIIVALMFKESRLGILLRATRDDETAAGAMGIHKPGVRWIAFVFSALLAGIGGGLWGHFVGSFSPKAFYLKETFVILGMLVIGGPGTITGAVLGVFLVTIAFESLRALEASLNAAKVFSGHVVGVTEISLAVVMIVVLALRPGGFIPTREIGDTILGRLRSKRSKT
jgi:branched-chain amino acid transport system permease protein